MGCTPSKKNLEKQTGEAPEDATNKKVPKRPASPPSKNGEVHRTNGSASNKEEIKPQSAQVVTVTPTGDSPDTGLNICNFSNLPDDIPYIDDDVASKRGSVMFPEPKAKETPVEVSVEECSLETPPVVPSGEPPLEEGQDDQEAKRKRLEENLEALIVSAEADVANSAANPAEVTEESIECIVAEEDNTEVKLVEDDGKVEKSDAIADVLNQLDAAAGDDEVSTTVVTETRTEVSSNDDGETSVVTKETITVVKTTDVDSAIDTTEDDGGVDPAAEGAALEDRFYNNKAFEKPDIDASDPQQQEAAVKIQTKYRQHHAKQEVQTVREEQAAIKIQAGIRGYHDRNKVQQIRHERAEVSKQVEEEAAAADAADAASRGGNQPEEEPIDIDLEDPDVAAAASKIQAGFKGYKARKEVQEMKRNEGSIPEEPHAESTLEDGVRENMEGTKAEELMDEIEEQEDEIKEQGVEVKEQQEEIKEQGDEVKEQEDQVEELEKEEINPDAPEDHSAEESIDLSALLQAARMTAAAAGEDVSEVTHEAIQDEMKVVAEQHREAPELCDDVQIGETAEEQDNESGKVEEGEATPQAETETQETSDEITLAAVDGTLSPAAEEVQAAVDETEPGTEVSEGQAAVEVAKDEAAVEVVKDEAAVEVAEDEAAVEVAKDEAAVEVAKDEAAIEVAKDEAAVEVAKDEAAVEVAAAEAVEDEVVAEDEAAIGEGQDAVAEENEQAPSDEDAVPAADEVKQTAEPVIEPEDETKEVVMTTDIVEEGEGDGNAAAEQEVKGDAAEEEVVDIDLTDPEVNAAASKIQAGFKGMKTRKELKAKAEADDSTVSAPAAEEAPAADESSDKVDIDLNDPEMEKAAAKIQAGFKGYKTRQELKTKKEDGEES